MDCATAADATAWADHGTLGGPQDFEFGSATNSDHRLAESLQRVIQKGICGRQELDDIIGQASIVSPRDKSSAMTEVMSAVASTIKKHDEHFFMRSVHDRCICRQA